MPVDPICGMEVDESSRIRAEVEGETFYFCCEHCREKFLDQRGIKPCCSHGHAHAVETHAHSHEHAGGAHATREPPPSGPVIYTCPMHPEIEQDHPGDCPKCGMALEPKTVSAAAPEDNAELRDMTRRFWVAVALSAPILALSMGEMLAGWHFDAYGKWAQLVLSTPVVFWAGWPFFKRAWRSIVTRQLNMFTLIAIGTGAAYVSSVAAVLFPQIFPAAVRQMGEPPVYFESAAIITALVLMGQVLELRARSRTGDAIRELLNLAPHTARVVRDGVEEEMPVEHVQAGDVLRVRPGEKAPVDGVITDGSGVLDESMITGEPVPADKKPGDKVTGGTINQSGSFLMRAERVGRDTVLAHIVDMVAQAQRSRAPIQKLADVVAAYFVPAVLVVAAATFVAWNFFGPEPRFIHGLVNAIAVLIIACPCALGLATPMSIMVGVGRGARAGVLIKDGAVLEALEKVDTIVVDKTGTLTVGKPRVEKVVPLPPFDENAVLEAAASVEHQSEHPLAAAVVRAARERNIELRDARDFQSVAGSGAAGRVNGNEVVAGKRRFLAERGVQNLDALDREAANLRADARTTIFVAIGGRAAGVLALSDPIKDSTPDAVAQLHEFGLKLIIVTGDNEAVAQAVAKKLDIDEVVANVPPREKNQIVKKLQSEGKRVAMAGDGINDAPALAQADVGIAMGTGTDVAIESAGVTLVQGDLRGIVKAIKLSRAMMRNIRQNLFLAFAYNVLAVPIAAGALYPFFGLLLNPMIAGAAMSFSSVSVVLNALRLRKVAL
jgi:P-type Cu+ transporter